jgi:hypothetical protein
LFFASLAIASAFHFDNDPIPAPFAMLMLAWVIIVAALARWFYNFRCPRCGQAFSPPRRVDFSVPRYCLNCGLVEGSSPTSEVAKEFKARPQPKNQTL